MAGTLHILFLSTQSHPTLGNEETGSRSALTGSKAGGVLTGAHTVAKFLEHKPRLSMV